MSKVEMVVKKNKCGLCGYVWEPKSTRRSPLCPKCRSLRWDYENEKEAKKNGK